MLKKIYILYLSVSNFYLFFKSLVAPTVSAQAVIGAVEDRPVVLSCEAKAYPKAMVEWMRYGKIWRFFILPCFAF